MTHGDRHDRLPALEALGREFARLAASDAPRRARLAPTALRLAAASALLAVVLAATPPGRSLAHRVGELVGIGDEPTSQQSSVIDFPDAVIGIGESPNGTDYEIVASSDQNLTEDSREETCVMLHLPPVRGPVSGNCLTGSMASMLGEWALAPAGVHMGPEALGSGRLVVHGMASTEVDRLEVIHHGAAGDEHYPVQLARLDAGLQERIGASGQVGFYVAFLPTDLVPSPEDTLVPPEGAAGASPSGEVPTPQLIRPEDVRRSAAAKLLSEIEVIAYDSYGEVLARRRLDEGGPYAALSLYPPERPAEAGAAAAAWEECLREVAGPYGTPGEIKPELPASVIGEIERCVNDRMNTADAPQSR